MPTSTNESMGELARLETRLRELVTVLEGAQTDPTALERAWKACAEHAPAVASVTTPTPANVGAKGALRAQLVRLVELNAIAVETARRAQESLSVELERVKLARGRLEGVASVDPRGAHARATETGASCDVTS